MIDRWWSNIRRAVRTDNQKELAEKNKPPADAIPINRPDGTPYMHVWHESNANRICVMFSDRPGVAILWAAETVPDLITAFGQIQAKIKEGKHE